MRTIRFEFVPNRKFWYEYRDNGGPVQQRNDSLNTWASYAGNGLEDIILWFSADPQFELIWDKDIDYSNPIEIVWESGHIHEWKQYIGLIEMFEYCKVCNEKRK